jgi:hypothetical protein
MTVAFIVLAGLVLPARDPSFVRIRPMRPMSGGRLTMTALRNGRP